ncbi:MAG: thioredoxin domain-containing protein [Nitrospirota bacterium]
MNRLSKERSAYLKHAAGQKIDWYPWSEESFEKAKKEGKPLFLSSGAVWCHWCHVMAKESFYDDETGKLLNDNFISIKLDRDERPDIDRRYQMAVAAMGESGGWPLSIFLTPDKKPFYGGTYFPPEDRMGRPGFKKVLRAVSEFYRSKQDEIAEYTGKLLDSLKPLPLPDGEISEIQLDETAKKILTGIDMQNGGFGSAPKFPMPGAIEFLINRYVMTGDESIGHAIRITLNSMAAGGFCDHLGGGFHRYSTDEAWTIPHFEKMADDNAWLFRNYLTAYAVFGDQFYREVAVGITGFIKDVLSDPDGGFYVSQDADVTPDDEGGYFTWTDEDFRRILDDDEYRVLSLHLMHESGAMHHDSSKKVLFAVMGAKEIAEETGMNIEDVIKIADSGKGKLLKERDKREMPFIDKTLYTSINGMLISVFLQGYRILGDSGLKDLALRSLNRIMETFYADGKLFHTEGIPAMLDDYVHLIDALIEAYEVTADRSYIDRADELMELSVGRLWDREHGGFFDTDDHLLDLRIREIEDIPRPSANSLAIRLLLKLHYITEKATYFEYAEKALRSFNERAMEVNVHAGYYFSSLDAYFNTVKISVNAAPDSELSKISASLFGVSTCIVYGKESGSVIPCIRGACYDPVHDPGELKTFLKEKKYLK